MVTITNGPKPMPAIAALLAKPGDFGQNRLTITLIVGIDAAACPIAKTTPYKITNCQKSCTNQINPVPNATIVIAIESITRISNLSAILPTIGIAKAETIMQMVTAKDSDERLQPVSSLMSGSIKPKTDNMPALKKRTMNPVPKTAQLLFIFYFHKKFLSENKTYYS